MPMYEQEQKQITHLMVLLWNTILSLSIIVFTLSQGQGPMAVVLLSAGLIVCWTVHLTDTLPAQTRLWLYTILLMLTFFYYGTHEESVFDIASVMVGFILVYISTEDVRFVRLCAAVYVLTMLYDFTFLSTGTAELSYYRLDRIVIHFLIVLMSERMGEVIINKFRRDRKNTEETISRLEEVNHSAEDFLTNVSHELRTPINAVTGITTALLKQEADPEKQKQLLSVQKAGNRLFDRVEDILDYSELDTGRISISEEAYSVTSLINDIIAENRRLEQPLDVELIFDVDPNIPAVLLGDGRKVKKIINHLTVNAMKFTKKGGVHVRIFATPKSYGVNLCIRVSDTGVGIAADELDKITERFFQSNSGRNRQNGGLGLGIPIAYGMATAMGGFVQIESKEDVGTVVSVSIPQQVAEPDPCMKVTDRTELSLALYLLPEKYEVPEVRDQYNTTISHMVRGLELAVHRVFRLEELKRLVSMVKLSHLFISEAEYEEEPVYFEQISQSLEVIVIAGEAFLPTDGSRIKIIRKPFYSLSVVNILNDTNAAEDDVAEKEIMTCPGVRVLVVDDEPVNLQVSEGIFRAWDMEVRTAGSGMQAIELCAQTEFDLIFLDHMMPEMDGVETLMELRKLWINTDRKPVVIAFSANVVSGAREMFLQKGFDGFIAKPLEDRELKRLLKRVLPDTAIVYTEKSDEKAQAADWLRHLPEKIFRTEAGLRYCNRDSAFYQDVLLRFAKDADGKIAQMEEALQADDMKDYQLLSHTLKSSAKMIGAEVLSELAKDLETAARTSDVEYIRAHHSPLLEQYRKTAQSILDVMSSAEEISGGTEISKKDLLEALGGLRSAFDTYESDKAEALLADMSGSVYRGTPVCELLRELRQDLENFEWDAAAKRTEALINRLEGGEA